jgi:hypothetical protein
LGSSKFFFVFRRFNDGFLVDDAIANKNGSILMLVSFMPL